MKGRIVLVTGANAGIGKAAVIDLADKGATVIMLCHSQERGKQAYDEIMLTPGRNVSLMLCDLGSRESIKGFVEAFKSRYDRLDVLINCAGVITLDRRETADGLELQFGVNHMGHFMLTLLLLDKLERSDAGRIVVFSSGAHKAGKIHFDDYNLTKGYNVAKSYCQSKLANLLFVRELARRLQQKGSRITVNAVHPGAVATQIGANREKNFGKGIVRRILSPLALTPSQGAATAIFLAEDTSVTNTTGQYFYKCKLAKTSQRSWDMAAAKRLFELSEAICGIHFEDLILQPYQ